MMISIILILDLEGDGLQEKRALAQVWLGRERERGRGKTEIMIDNYHDHDNKFHDDNDFMTV